MLIKLPVYAQMRDEQEQAIKKVQSEARTPYKKDDSIFDSINRIPIQDLAEQARGVTTRDN